MAYSSGVKTFLREAASWGSVIAIGFGCVYFYDDLRSLMTRTISTVTDHSAVAVQDPVSNENGFERSVTLKADGRGHFLTRAYINGRPIVVMVDTGATKVALSYEDADRLGLRPTEKDFTLRANTANGIARGAPVNIGSVRIGDVEVKNLRGSISEPGTMSITLLGMEFIRRLERFEMRGRELTLVE
ncbi:MAG: TIGR02281 family clan AA aspartic protease [Hyphomicrobiaceae bacterium]|nr:TIGR02281 family clan AA aspartic protease [Hyphomicrobiaceae bacterium]